MTPTSADTSLSALGVEHRRSRLEILTLAVGQMAKTPKDREFLLIFHFTNKGFLDAHDI